MPICWRGESCSSQSRQSPRTLRSHLHKLKKGNGSLGYLFRRSRLAIAIGISEVVLTSQLYDCLHWSPILKYSTFSLGELGTCLCATVLEFPNLSCAPLFLMITCNRPALESWQSCTWPYRFAMAFVGGFWTRAEMFTADSKLQTPKTQFPNGVALD